MLLANSRRTRKWEPIETHNGLGNAFIDFSHANPGDFAVKGKEDKEEIAEMLANLAIKWGPRVFAKQSIQLQ